MTEEKTGNSGWMLRLALALAIIALFLSLQERFSTEDEAIEAINQMISETLMPGVKKATERDVIGHIYDLKRVMVTLEEIKETSENPEVQAMVDQLRKDIETLNVKLFVHE